MNSQPDNSKARQFFIRLLAIAAFLCISPWLAYAQDDGAEFKPISAAFLGFDTDKNLKDEKENLTALMDGLLSAEGTLMMVERASLEKVLSEQELGLSGAVNPDSAMKLGNLLGAQVMITSRAFKVGNKIYLVAKLIGVETGRVFGETHFFPQGQDLGEGVIGLAQKISSTAQAKKTLFTAPRKEKEDVVAVLLKKLGEGERPKVSVKISEMHLSSPVNDPAAETELLYILKALGFTVVDPESTEADLRIVGEAFSEFALRKGNLTSVKGRVEVKVLDRKNDIVAVDRYVATTIDLSEHIAGKESLAQASRQIALRVVPKLK